jgi:hypothetical protein
MGGAPETRDLFDWGNDVSEIWGMNRFHLHDFMKMDKITAWFQLHPIKYLKELRGRSQRDKQHWEWLTQKHPFPIYMQKHYDEFPSSIAYPITTAREQFGNFYTSTCAYMAALSILQGFERVEAYGFEMAAETEYFYQRDSTEYFIGLMLGKGIEVYLPPNTGLLKGSVYAFTDDTTGFLQQLELKKFQLTNKRNKHLAQYYIALGKYNKLEELFGKYDDIEDAEVLAYEDYEKKRDLVQHAHGAVDELEENIKLYKSFYNTLGGVYFNGR